MRTAALVVVLFALGELTGCQHRRTPDPAATPPVADTAAPAPNANVTATASNAFAFDLYRRLRTQKGNLVFAPACIHLGLTMIWAGARGPTATEMKKVLHLDATPETAMASAAAVIARFTAPDRYTIVRAANRLFGDQTVHFEAPFVALLAEAPVAVDFRAAPEAARSQIDAYVGQATDGRIPGFLPPQAIQPATRLVLASAMAFTGRWSQLFAEGDTRPVPFHPAGKAAHEVATMHRYEERRSAKVDDVRLLELAYAGGDSMLFILPDAADGLDDVEKRIDDRTLRRWLAALADHDVRMALPRFKVEPLEPLRLVDALSALGMPLAFEGGKADFSGMGSAPEPLYLRDLYHQAVISVDEHGTRAAAGLYTIIDFWGRHEPPNDFFADHPFLFILRDGATGLILFMGRVDDPV